MDIKIEAFYQWLVDKQSAAWYAFLDSTDNSVTEQRLLESYNTLGDVIETFYSRFMEDVTKPQP